jgi:hypothetical protein
LQAVERQVERLGFAERYIVSASQGPNGDRAKIRLIPTAPDHTLRLVQNAA